MSLKGGRSIMLGMEHRGAGGCCPDRGGGEVRGTLTPLPAAELGFKP